jgi:hypothetical protein
MKVIISFYFNDNFLQLKALKCKFPLFVVLLKDV